MKQGAFRRSSAWVVCAALFVAMPAAAHGETDLGQTSTDTTFNNCAGTYTQLQQSSAGLPSYTVPAGGGVITAWSHEAQAMGGTGNQLKLKIYRATANPDVWTVVGQSAAEPLTTGPNSFLTRIPVQAADVLGYTRTDTSKIRCLFPTAAAADVVRDAVGADTATGDTTTFDPILSTNLRINIAAVLEPDADADGYGDETQDNCVGISNPMQTDGDGDGRGDACDVCPTVAGSGADGCVPVPVLPIVSPAVTPTGLRSAALKKCAKKKTKATRKKCKKRALKLPV